MKMFEFLELKAMHHNIVVIQLLDRVYIMSHSQLPIYIPGYRS